MRLDVWKNITILLLAIALIPAAFASTPTYPGDLNNDLSVNILDIQLVSGCLGQNAVTCQSGRADPNNDNSINLFDFISVSQYWGQTYSSGSLPSGLFASYSFENNAQDSSGSGLHGTLIGTTSFNTGRYGQALSLSGTGHVDLGNPTGLNDKRPITITAWINPNQVNGYLIGKRSGSCTGYWRIDPTLTSSWLGPGRTANITTLAPLNTWSHIAVTWDGANPKIYLNAQDATAATNTNSISGSDTTCHLLIGSRDGTQSNVIGKIDEVRLYNRILSQAEIQTDMNTQGNGQTTPAICGDGVVSGTEQCDSTNLNGETCTSQGFTGGTLSCSGTCTYVTSACTSSDTTNPTVSFTTPASGATVSGTTSITTTATDNVAVQNVQFRVDGTTLNTDTTSPYSYAWDTTTATNAQHTLTIIATDTSGNTATATRTVTVNNAAPAQCGNAVIEGTEQCDGTALGGATCISRGFTGGTLSCSASCTYDTAACTSTPPPAGTLCANEPPGMTVINNRAFNAKVENGWTDRGDPAFSIATDASTDAGAPSPQSSPNVGQALFQGALGGGGPINTALILASQPNTLYFCFQNQFSNNFYGADIAGINKMFHIWNVHGSVVVLSAQGSAMNALSPQMRLQNIKIGPNIPSYNINPSLNSTPFQRGKWQQVEVLLVLNTPGQLNGEIHWWVDGSKKGQKLDVGYLASADAGGWRQVSWNPTYGSGFPNGTKDIVPAPQYQWIDNWYISGK